MSRVNSLTRRRFLGMTARLLAAGGAGLVALPRPIVAALPAAPRRPPSAAGSSTRLDVSSRLPGLLRLTPDTPKNRAFAVLIDVQLVLDLTGLTPPSAFDDDYAALKYAIELPKAGAIGFPFISGLTQGPDRMWAFRDYVGFHAGDVRQTVYASDDFDSTEIILGRFDPEATERLLAACSECPAIERQEHRGIRFYSWGADFENDVKRVLKPPAFDANGRFGRLAVQPSAVYRTLSTATMQGLIDTQLGLQPSLADDDAYSRLTSGMGELGVHSMLITTDTESESAPRRQERQQSDPRAPEEVFRQATDPATLLRPYELMALGARLDSQGPSVAIGLMHASDALAQENVDRLRRRIDQAPSLVAEKPWRDVVTDLDVRAEGRLLLATLRKIPAAELQVDDNSYGIWWFHQWVDQESLLFYE